MSFFDKVKEIFSGRQQSKHINIYLECEKCHQKIKVLLRKSYDIQRVYNPDEEAEYRINKVVICDNCYNKIKIKVDFDKSYKILSREIEKGSFITAEQFGSAE